MEAKQPWTVDVLETNKKNVVFGIVNGKLRISKPVKTGRMTSITGVK